MAWNATPLSLVGLGQSACGLPIGNGHGTVAVVEKLTTRWGFNIVLPSGKSLGQILFWSGDLFAQPAGFIADEGDSSVNLVGRGTFDDNGELIHALSGVLGNALFAADPNGGLLAAGQLVPGGPEPTRATPQSVMMFDTDGNIRWGPVALGTQARIETLAVDLAGRSLVLFDGTDLFGAGTLAGIWFDGTGAMTGPFMVASAGRVFIELHPLIPSGFAIAAIRAGPTTGVLESDWVASVPSGEARVEPVPSWLAARPNTNLAIARGRRAYAMLPRGEFLEVCHQQLEVVSAAGDSCGRIDLPIDAHPCLSRELRLGLDGTVLQMMPRSREPFDPPGSSIRDCTVRFWPAALK